MKNDLLGVIKYVHSDSQDSIHHAQNYPAPVS